MGDGGAEGAVLGLLRVDVDPLMVARRLGEQIDAALIDLEPVALSEVLADGVEQGLGLVEDSGHEGLLSVGERI